MTRKEELYQILELIRKYNLPLSPILEFAIKEKIEEQLSNEQIETTNNVRKIDHDVITQTYKNGTNDNYDTSEDFLSKEEEKRVEVEERKQHKRTSRYVIRVKYPDGRVFDSNLVWETLVDVIKYAGPKKVEKLNILCMGDNLVSTRLNDNPLYRSAQKEIGGGLYVCTYSSTDIKLKQIVRINMDCHLGLKIEKVYIDEKGERHSDKSEEVIIANGQRTVIRNRTKYSFEGGPFLSKRRFVLEVVKQYVRNHPRITYESLIRVFPATLHSNKSNGVVKQYNDVLEQIAQNADVRNRFFLKKNEIIELSNGIKIVVHNQWGNDFEKFLKVAEILYDVKSSDDDNIESFPKVSKSIPRVDEKQQGIISDDKRMGYIIRVFPSQHIGKIVDIRKEGNSQKLVIKTKNGEIIEVADVPYFYEIFKK